MIPNNEIWYTTSDGQTITPSGLSPTSNTYSGGKGVLQFASNVTSIPDGCFKNQTTLTSVVCPSSVTSLGASVILGSSVSAFTCEYATSFAYDHCLWQAKQLVSYKNNVATTTGGVGMFEGNISMVSVEMTACTNFGIYCFSNCSSLTSIKLGDTPPTIMDYSTFNGVPSSGTFYVPSASVSAYETWKNSGFNSTPIRNWTVVGYNLKTATAMTVSNVSWVTDIPGTGGTGNSGNCLYTAVVDFDDGTTETNPEELVVSGEITADTNNNHLRRDVGQLNLTFSIDELSYQTSVEAYQEGLFKTIIPYNNIYRDGVNLN